jgi:hypothetical protein
MLLEVILSYNFQNFGSHVHIYKRTSFKYRCKRIGLRHPKLKAQQGVEKIHLGILNGPETSGPITQETYLAGQTN